MKGRGVRHISTTQTCCRYLHLGYARGPFPRKMENHRFPQRAVRVRHDIWTRKLHRKVRRGWKKITITHTPARPRPSAAGGKKTLVDVEKHPTSRVPRDGNSSAGALGAAAGRRGGSGAAAVARAAAAVATGRPQRARSEKWGPNLAQMEDFERAPRKYARALAEGARCAVRGKLSPEVSRRFRRCAWGDASAGSTAVGQKPCYMAVL